MQLWPPCRKILVRTVKTFCSNSGNDEKKINFPRNLFLLKIFVWSCTKKFWQNCRNFVAKHTKNFPIVQRRWSYIFFTRDCFHQKRFSSNGKCNFDNPTKNFSTKNHTFVTQIPKGREKLWIFGGKNIFPQIVLLHMENPLVTNPLKICRQNAENFLIGFRKWWKNCALSKQNDFYPKYSSEHAQWDFGKPAVTLLPKIRETFLNCKNVEVTIFWSEFVFIENNSLTTDNAILATLPKSFLPKTTDLQLKFQKMTRKFMNFSKEKCFSSNCASVRVECSCDHPVKTFSSKLWKLFAGIPQMTKKW